MKFNMCLDKEQINDIASVTADKVLETVKYQKDNERWYEREIESLKIQIAQRNSLLVSKDLTIERLKETIRRLKSKLDEE